MANSPMTGKSVVVTGGASGIGLAIVRFFAAYSTKIAILDISTISAESIVSSLKTEFASTTFVFKKCDISDWDEQKAVFEEVYKEHGSVDIVCANAGVSEITKFLAVAEGEPEKPNLRTLDINLIGTLYSIKLAVHFMRKNKTSQKGTIICTASNAGIYPFPMAPIYTVSKHAVVGAVRSMAKPLEADGIRINGLCPNAIGKFIQIFPFMQALIGTATNIADSNLFANMAITPMASLTSAVNEIMLSPQLTGVTLEISGEKVTHRMPPEWVDEISRSNFESFWALGYA